MSVIRPGLIAAALLAPSAPAGLMILEARRDMVWGVEHDEQDVPYVARYRVRGGPW
jgi:hypothetical protein